MFYQRKIFPSIGWSFFLRILPNRNEHVHDLSKPQNVPLDSYSSVFAIPRKNFSNEVPKKTINLNFFHKCISLKSFSGLGKCSFDNPDEKVLLKVQTNYNIKYFLIFSTKRSSGLIKFHFDNPAEKFFFKVRIFGSVRANFVELVTNFVTLNVICFIIWSSELPGCYTDWTKRIFSITH